MGLYKRGKRWYGSVVNAEGKLIRKSLSSDRRVAERILAQMREQFELQRFGLLPKSLPEACSKDMESIRREFYEQAKLKGRSDGYFLVFNHLWKQLIVKQGIRNPEGLTIKLVREWAAEQFRRGNKGQSINQRASMLRAFTKWCTQQGYYTSDPLAQWERVKVSEKDYRRDLEVSEIEAILANEEDPEFRLRWEVYFLTGFRKMAGAALSWEWIDWQQRVIVLPIKYNKSKRTHPLPMHPHLYKSLLTRYEEKGRPTEGRVFSAVSSNYLLDRFKKVCTAAGIDLRGVCLHSVRHTFAMLIYTASGGNVKLVQKVLDHQNIATTGEYLHADNGAIRDTLENLGITFEA